MDPDNGAAFNAEEYDSKIEMTVPHYHEFYRQITDVVHIYFDGSVRWLDVGCGTGKMAEAAFRKNDIEEFVFCDNSVRMLEIAKERFENEKAVFLETSVLDLAENIGKCGRFDVVTAVQVFHYLTEEERKEAVRICYNLLKPGGIFITFENFAPYTDRGKALFLKRWKEYQISQGKSPEESKKHIGRYGRVYFPITLSEHLEVLSQCCFTDAEVIWVSNMQAGLLGIK